MNDDEVLAWTSKFRTRIVKDLYVFTMAMTQLSRPGARTRAINAARRLREIVRESSDD